MIFHENRLLADDSHEISYLIFLKEMLQNVSSAAVVIGALKVNQRRKMAALVSVLTQTHFDPF